LIHPIPFKEEQKADDFIDEGSGGERTFKGKVAGCWRECVNIGDWKGASIDKIY